MFSCISVQRLIALVFAVSIPLSVAAQGSTQQAVRSLANNVPTKWDIFAGYSYLSPHATVETKLGQGTFPFDDVPVRGEVIGSIARYFNKNLGVEIVGDIHLQNDYPYPGKFVTRNSFSGGSGGFIYRFRNSSTTPFVHVLFGGEIADGPHYQDDNWGPVLTVGGGFDCETPWFHHHMSIRMVQADYQYVHENWGTGIQGGIGNINALRLSAGAVFHGGIVVPPVEMSVQCSAQQSSVFPGEPVTVTAKVENVTPGLHAVYNWSGNGVTVTGDGATATISTASLAPGNYTVKVEASEDHSRRACLRVIPPQTAHCMVAFTVKKFEPPTVDCTVVPGAIKPGDTATVTANAVSPQGRPLTYSYSASAGTVTGTGSTAVFNSAGAPTGSVSIPCVVMDDYNQTATSTASATILQPYVPPVSHTKVLCSIAFDKDKKRPTRVNNEAKACLDEVALDLQKQPDSTIVLVGSDDAKEKAKAARDQKAALRNKHLKVEDNAAERAVNTKDYLVKEKGIDASRIVVATSPVDDQNVEDYLVPAGANFHADVPRTTPVNEAVVKPVTRKPLAAKPVAHKKAAAPVKKAVKPAQ
jgi:hypothetical protein